MANYLKFNWSEQFGAIQGNTCNWPNTQLNLLTFNCSIFSTKKSCIYFITQSKEIWASVVVVYCWGVALVEQQSFLWFITMETHIYITDIHHLRGPEYSLFTRSFIATQLLQGMGWEGGWSGVFVHQIRDCLSELLHITVPQKSVIFIHSHRH